MLRVAIWSAVSSLAQAGPEKVSLELQLQKGREFIQARHYTPAGEYVVPGKSRTRYISLYHAEKNIDQLHALLESAQHREFDLLWVYDLDRFRHLMRQVFDALCDYEVQLYIHTYPREPVPQKKYDEEQKNAVGMIVDLSNMISRSGINTLQRHFREKMPERIKKGLDARLGGIKYGYRKIHPLDKNTPLEIDPPKAKVAIRIKDMYLEGKSLKNITRVLNDEFIPAPQGGIWYPQTIYNILESPFYAGIVYFGRTIYELDRRTGKQNLRPNPNPIYAKGKHPALWDEPTYHRIQNILNQRGFGYKGDKTKLFTSLLYCWCGAPMHSDKLRGRGTGRYYRCSSKKLKHTFIMERDAKEMIFPIVIKKIQQIKNTPYPKQQKTDQTNQLQQELADLQRKQKKWMDAYENEDIDMNLLRDRVNQIQTRLDQVHNLIAKNEALSNQQVATRQTITELAQLTDGLDVYLCEAPAPRINAALRSFIKKIHFTKEKQISLQLH